MSRPYGGGLHTGLGPAQGSPRVLLADGSAVTANEAALRSAFQAFDTGAESAALFWRRLREMGIAETVEASRLVAAPGVTFSALRHALTTGTVISGNGRFGLASEDGAGAYSTALASNIVDGPLLTGKAPERSGSPLRAGDVRPRVSPRPPHSAAFNQAFLTSDEQVLNAGTDGRQQSAGSASPTQVGVLWTAEAQEQGCAPTGRLSGSVDRRPVHPERVAHMWAESMPNPRADYPGLENAVSPHRSRFVLQSAPYATEK
jgi:hypothetical protein